MVSISDGIVTRTATHSLTVMRTCFSCVFGGGGGYCAPVHSSQTFSLFTRKVFEELLRQVWGIWI